MCSHKEKGGSTGATIMAGAIVPLSMLALYQSVSTNLVMNETYKCNTVR